MDRVQMTNNADTHSNELENGGARHVASRSLGILFGYIFITILMSLLRINYTYEKRRQERQGGR